VADEVEAADKIVAEEISAESGTLDDGPTEYDEGIDEVEEVDTPLQDDVVAIPIAEPESPDTTGGLALRTLDLQNFKIGPTGLLVTGEPTLEEWAGIGELLRTLEHGLQWAVGDWICAGEGRYGDRAAQILDHTAWSVRTTAIYRWAASRVPPENRRSDLTFSHHLVVADLPVDEQRAWLEKAAQPVEVGEETWSVQRLKREMAVVTAKGTVMRYLLVVDCDNEVSRDKLKTKLERSGLICRTAEATRKRVLKVGKAKRVLIKAKKAAPKNGRRKKGGVRGGRRRKGAFDV
jgi:hypothetical protein